MEENITYDRIKDVSISSEIKQSFLSYAMSVIVQRALPDVKDGLKPVHRRILYGMNELGMYSNKPYKKCARITGEVMGKYHPHGDASIYDALVRMAQDFSYRYMLVDGHGNFGSIDGDGAAAQRYTEARMSKISMELLRDIKKDTIDFVKNYDGEENEPVVLPAHFPNLLVNGSTGIAVGMATNIPPHNLGECIDATIAIMENPDITIMELMENYIHGPDFPTGAIILGRSGIKSAYETGKGLVIVRSKARIEEMDNGKTRIIVTEIPYQVNKANLIERIATLVRDKLIDGITDLRDESNRNGISIVIELRRDVQSEVVLNQLYRLTALQTTFGVNTLALVDNVPRVLNVKECLEEYLKHQITVIQRRTAYELRKAEERDHIVSGLIIALDNIDEIINILRTSADDEEAVKRMMEGFALSEVQANAIMEMRMRRLTGLNRQKIIDEHNELLVLIAELKDILANHHRVLEIIKTELLEVKENYGDERRTEIAEGDFDLEDEDLIPVENIVVTLTTNGYIKRNTVDTYRTQNRGGRGIKGMAVNDDDIVDQVITMSTHDYLLCFTNFGKVYRIKGYRVPAAGRTAKGIPTVNLLNLDKDEKVKSLVPVSVDSESKYLFFVTIQGLVKRVHVSEFESIRQNGKIAISLKDGDELFNVKLTSGEDEIIIAGTNGKAVRFEETDVRPMGRNAAGVKGYNVDGGTVVGVATNREGNYILSITEHGYGKKTALDDYRKTSRGAKGVTTINITERNGGLVTLRAVSGDEDLLIITDAGVLIRISLSNVAVYGRSTQGVKLINVDDECVVSSVAVIDVEEDEESNESEEVVTENKE